MEAIWNSIKIAIKMTVPEHSYRMWLEPIEFSRVENGVMVLSAPNYFSQKRAQDNYGSLILSELKKVTGEDNRYTVEVAEKRRKIGLDRMQKSIQLPLPSENIRPHYGRFLRKDFTFDHFVVGGNNEFAFTASLSLAANKNSQQNCLFLLSKTGMGKSHLSQAVGHHIISQCPSERVYYLTAEDFSNEMVQAYKTDSIDKFKGKYRKECDILLLEDVHVLSGKERTQIELALTLDTLLDADKKIIFSSCYLPGDIPKLNDKLKSRFSYGIISSIEPPNFRTRVRILQKKMLSNGYQVKEDIINYLASELTEDVRQLESGLIGVTARSSLMGVPIDLGLAEIVVKNIAQRKKSITIDLIKKLVCKHFNISLSDLISNSRKQAVMRPRQIAIYLSRRYTDSPLQTIGKSFNKYHATALHSIGVIERGIKDNGSLKKQVELFCQKLESGNF
ncbi:MAG: chromosomal replication initiator protein DnaA [Desulfobacterium sp.]|nr:chromosomal replication initiator protein DnaA [Desulfobacterium sp.]MBU3949514.1 chromosomal replication initiator protein DnaA [Pseudomonadota bacterium]MBU4034927.1 chromosomal replication initiator protein DnaA [Pseudomonadota bacterium]